MTHVEQLLKYHQYQGQSNDCAPFSVAIVVNTLKDAVIVEGDQLAMEMNQPRLRWVGPLPVPLIRRVPNWATFPWGVADVLRQYGIRCRWQFGADPGRLRRALAEDRIALPVIGELRPLWAHIKPLAAVHPQDGWGFSDPAYSGSELVWQSDSDFQRLWRNYGCLLVETL
jgi:hypothetical protein